MHCVNKHKDIVVLNSSESLVTFELFISQNNEHFTSDLYTNMLSFLVERLCMCSIASSYKYL